ncbi:hypothetical protein P692DRAFT_20585643 [Suillus brevipes Sb2]|nr:hypothetical protein P692DRAFT_20585643 [Suillus brevipes Sb2]
MRRMYYYRFSGLRSCCIISSLPGLVIFIFSIVSPSSPIFLFFSSPLLPLYFRPFFSLPQVHDYWICQRQRPSLVVAVLSFPFFHYCHHHYHHFFSICSLALFCVSLHHQQVCTWRALSPL